MNNIAVITTFPNNMWDVYAKKMVESYVKYWPKDIPLMVQLDNDLLYTQLDKIIPAEYGIFVGHTKEHNDFVERNKDKDHPTDYRKQAVRFCHKVFAIHHALDAIKKAKADNLPDAPRYLIWLDADVITTRPVTREDIEKCLPKEGDAVAYLGRKDWDHSECGWLAFDLENGGDQVIEEVFVDYKNDEIFNEKQWHDSWIWDRRRHAHDLEYVASHERECTEPKWTNLTQDKPGTEIWQQSPMAAWSVHYKGPKAKQELYQQPKEQIIKQPVPGQNFVIQTKNAIPNEEILEHIRKNQELIKNWLHECTSTDEEIVVVSAGPHLIAEDVREQVAKGRKVVAVKHALQPLKKAGITPWACILLDPRPHVADFVTDADTKTLWFVASQVNPRVTEALLSAGCEVWGYHASVGANETDLTNKQPDCIVNGGSATATRGLYLLHHLGFRNFHLYGYELSYPDKPNLDEKDSFGQPKYMEFNLAMKNGYVNFKKSFYSEPQLIAQYEELVQMIREDKFKLKAYGDGMLPFMLKCKELADLRQNELKCIMGQKITSYKEMLCKTKTSLPIWHKIYKIIHHKLKVSTK